ncbi:MAG: hypothetical protein F6K56_26115 [Moorea sp. SIO3G5]|nr:hypothetical protein [Moorena sp. SIO3G5]
MSSYSFSRSYEVQSSFTLIPCLDAAHRYCLFSVLCSLFPDPLKTAVVPLLIH